MCIRDRSSNTAPLHGNPDAKFNDTLWFRNSEESGVETVEDLDHYVIVVDDGTDVTIYFDRDGDGSWTGDDEDHIVLEGMGFSPAGDGYNSLADLKSVVNIVVEVV